MTELPPEDIKNILVVLVSDTFILIMFLLHNNLSERDYKKLHRLILIVSFMYVGCLIVVEHTYIH